METRWFLRLNRYFIHSSRGRESRKDTEKTPFTSDVSQLQVRGLSVEFQTQMKNTQRRDKTTGLKHEKTFFFFETESNNHSLTTASEFRRKVNTTGGEQAVESYREKFGFLQSSSLFFSFPNRRRPRVSVGEDAGPLAGCTGIQMRAEKALVDTQEWEQVPGDKDLEIRNTRGGAWSRGFQPTQELSPTLMFRLEEAALENQDWSWGWSYTVA